MANVYYARQNPKVFAQGLYEESATQKLPLGTRWKLADGRSYIYCKNGGTALAKGVLLQTAVIDTLAVDMVLNTAAAVGDDHIHVTYGAGTTATANYFREGFAVSEETTASGAGTLYKIDSHAAATSGGSLTIYLKDYVRAALTVTTTKITCIKHPCDAVVVFPTTATGNCVGVSTGAVTADYYFWAQYQGEAAVLVDTGDTLVVGTGVSHSSGATVAGACRVQVESELTQIIGVAHVVSAADKYAIVALNI